MLNLMCVIPNMEDATSLYRASGPLAALRKTYDFNILFMDQVGENKLEFADIVFMQRPAGDQHHKLAVFCHQNNIPLWVDYDDLLLEVPESNPAHGLYMAPEIRESIVKIIQLATVVTVSTEQLKKCLQPKGKELNQRVYVVNNAVSDRFLHLRKPMNHKKQVNWRGTNTHTQDLLEYGGEIIELGRENPDTTFTFVGYNPWFITKNIPMKQGIVVPAMPIGDYFRFMSATNPSIQIAPLSGSIFNLCKSNIAWLEACLVGAVCVAPDWDEWRKPGILTFQSGGEFKDNVQRLLNDPQFARNIHEEGWQEIKDRYLLSKVNQKRLEILIALHKFGRGQVACFPDGGSPVYDKETKTQLKVADGK